MAADTEQAAEQAERDAHAAHTADRPPTPEEERAAEEAAEDVPGSVGEHYEEMIDIGANVKGEGEVAP